MVISVILKEFWYVVIEDCQEANSIKTMGVVPKEMEKSGSDNRCLHFQVVVELGKFERKKLKNAHLQEGHQNVKEEPNYLNPFPKKEALALDVKNAMDIGSYPIVLWWSPLTGETGRLGQCGADACFFTINRTFQHHHMTKAFLFYGELGFSFLLSFINVLFKAELLLTLRGLNSLNMC